MATDAKPTETWQCAKEKMIAILAKQPDDSSYDELINAIVLGRAIDRGLADADSGRVVSHEEAVERIRSWRK